MKNKLIYCSILLLAVLAPIQIFAGYPPSWEWKTIQTDNFTIYYPEGHEKFAQRVLFLSDEVYKDVTNYFGVKPPKCPIVLNPGTDLLNGFYSTFPNRISLFETPAFHLRGFGPTSDIVDTVFTHEFTHFVHITTTAGWYKNLSMILGRGSSISNILSPKWMIEGITTNTETLFTDGGRGRCSYFQGQILSCTEDDEFWNLSASGISSPYRPPVNRFYLAGYHLVKFLNDTYGQDAFARISRYQAKHPVGGAYEAVQRVTGKNPSVFYNDFSDYLKAKTDQVKEQAVKTGLPQGKTLLSETYETVVSHFWTEDNTVLALRSGYGKKKAFIEVHPLTGAVISEFETGRINPLSSLRKLNDSDDVLFSAAYPHPLGNGQITSTDLTSVNTKTGIFKRLTNNMHLYSATISPDKSGFVATKRNGMWIDLLLLDNKGSLIKPLISKPGYLFEAPEWSPDGKSIVTVVKTGQNADIALINPDSGEMQFLFPTDIYEDNDPSFSPDGDWIVFSSNRKGVWNIFAWNIKAKKLFQLTSVFYGATEPRVSPNGESLSFLSLHHGVKTLCTTAFEPDNGKETGVSTLPATNKPNLKRVNPDIEFTPKRFPLIEAYTPNLHIPYIAGDDDSLAVGLWLQGADPVGINSYSASLFHKSVSDISNTAGTDAEKDTKGYVGYDITIANNSFWPTILARASEDIENGGFFWYRDRLIELGAQISVINRIMPDQITLLLTGGGRYRHQSSLDDSVSFYKDENDSTSIYGEFMLSRAPDFAPRDINPTCGQQLLISHEKGIEQFGGERVSRNSLISVKQFLPSFFNHHAFEMTGVYQDQKGLSYSKDLSLPRGFSRSDTEGGLNLDKNILVSGEYHFPLAYPDVGIGLSTFHINALKSSLFFDWGAGWNGTFNRGELVNKARKSIGGSLTCRASIYSLFNIETGIEGGYKLEENESFVNFVLIAGF